MAALIEMPKLSDTMTEGTLVRWLKNVGDTVKIGDEIAEIETDKATMVMEAFEDGVLHAIFVHPGEKAPLGARLALLVEPGEEPPVMEEQPATQATNQEPARGNDLWGGPGVTPVATGKSFERGNGSRDRVKASPLAKKLAEEKRLDLRELHGTGPAGRVIQRDVVAASGAIPAEAKPPAAKPSDAAKPLPGVPSAEDQRIPLSGMRSIIAERLVASKTQIPHFYLFIEVDGAPIWDLQNRINAAAKGDNPNKITINDLVLKAVACAATQAPAVNASWNGDSILRHAAVNLSVAIAVEDGLVTPVIRDAAKLSLTQISLTVKDFASRARAKKLSPDEFVGGTITVSNLGAYGIESFCAIINPPQAAILAIGAIRKTPVVNEAGQIVVGQRMTIGLSGDHRVVDGAVGAQFLAILKRLLEDPALMLL